jgi:hypothetical protein
MDVSDREVPVNPAGACEGGKELISTVVSLTGLPEDLVARELEGILVRAGCKPESLTLDDLRIALMAYLDSMHNDLADEDFSGSDPSLIAE